jgi:hypothetical protein
MLTAEYAAAPAAPRRLRNDLREPISVFMLESLLAAKWKFSEYRPDSE